MGIRIALAVAAAALFAVVGWSLLAAHSIGAAIGAAVGGGMAAELGALTLGCVVVSGGALPAEELARCWWLELRAPRG